MGENFEAKFVGEKISKVRVFDDSVGVESFLTGTYDSSVCCFLIINF